jgi:hypothetical protein
MAALMYVRLGFSIVAAVCTLSLGPGCSSEPPARSPSTPAAAKSDDTPVQSGVAHERTSPPTDAPEASRSKNDDRPTRFPSAARIVAVGDVHGDLQATLRVLRLGGLIDADNHWSGGDTVFVQTGDQLDRGDDEQAILDLLSQLETEAAAAGGAVHVLNGNHEYMNAAGDFRYVTPGGMSDFADAPGVDVTSPAVREVPEALRARAAAFLPGGPYAKVLATRNTAVIVGDSVFVHGGVLPKYAPAVEELNAAGRRWLSEGGTPPAELLAPDGLVWARDYSVPEPSPQACADLATALKILKVSRMVVGHTVQARGITSACDDKVWRIDVGMAKHYGGEPAALEIRGDLLSVLTEPV